MKEAGARYFRLVLVTGPAGSGKTHVLAAANSPASSSPISLGSALGGRLLELSRRQRPLETARILESLVEEAGVDPVILDNLEILFDPELQQDVLRLLQNLSRNRTIVAAWPGEYAAGVLTHADAGHPEFVRYTDPDALIVNILPPASHTS